MTMPPAFAPTAFEQMMVEQINRARANPLGEIAALITNTATRTGATPDITAALRILKVDMGMLRDQLAAFDPVAPLAWNAALGRSADAHSALMIQTDTQSHQLPGELSLRGRFEQAGYTGSFSRGENLFAYARDAVHAHAGFLIDWGYGPGGMQTPAGHRHAILNARYTEIGIGALVDSNPRTQVGPNVLTEHFGNRVGYATQLVGVTIRDGDGDRFYDIGEGMAGVQIAARGVAGSFVTTTWGAGGYQMALVPGSYTVTFSGGGLAGQVVRQVTFGAQNVKIDARADEARAAPVVTPIMGTAAAEGLAGNAAANILIGNGGADRFLGGAGNDTILAERRDVVFDAAAALVYRLAHAALDHAPDAASHLAWTRALLAGGGSDAAVAAVAAQILASAAGRAALGALSNDAFVAKLHDNIFDRAPDVGLTGAWTGLMTFGETRADVLAAMAQSTDYVARTEGAALSVSRAAIQADWSDDVFRLYRGALDRAPDAAGLTGWTGMLAGGRPFLDAVSGFTASAEFQRRFGGTDDRGFVTLLYNNVLDRAPDPGGFATWTQALASGRLSRVEVVQGFAQSTEFRRDTAPDVKAWMRAQGADDHLTGGAGRNVLVGGLGADCFVFDRATGGTHHVADLEPWDWLELTGFGYADTRSALSRFAQVGDDVVFAHQGVTVIFSDLKLAQITPDMLLI